MACGGRKRTLGVQSMEERVHRCCMARKMCMSVLARKRAVLKRGPLVIAAALYCLYSQASLRLHVHAGSHDESR